MALKNEPNLRIHSFFAIVALLAGLIFKITSYEFIILILTIGFVIVLELVNTSLEALVDIVSPGYHDKAKLAKDVCSGAVLISSLTAIFVGILIFLPRVLTVLL